MCFTIGSKLNISLEPCKEVLHYQVFAWQLILHRTTAITHPKMHRDNKCINFFQYFISIECAYLFKLCSKEEEPEMCFHDSKININYLVIKKN